MYIPQEMYVHKQNSILHKACSKFIDWCLVSVLTPIFPTIFHTILVTNAIYVCTHLFDWTKVVITDSSIETLLHWNIRIWNTLALKHSHIETHFTLSFTLTVYSHRLLAHSISTFTLSFTLTFTFTFAVLVYTNWTKLRCTGQQERERTLAFFSSA